ncbi:MAG: iron ABC transporter permease [Candidatus Cloacimonetes bacterium]|nr:iron ABC transporter permease [Candidatus Cloacimonadota bacterium]MCF7812951.1 iron ABC transporter permease [Candidatus Cloacimonadota bacterium]MCF7867162.1 iron ABC transporter permease [Candidatus Cloacimonadota bacterium]MCF7882518.1 iron ABC transporter permease [Candidatus Cloacimonadota bacterium]
MKKNNWLILIFAVLFAFLILFYLKIGNPSDHIIFSVRLPRIMLTFLTGFILAGVGHTFQMMLDNPLAEPYILGISSGAAFGSILAVVTGVFILMPIFGFAGALVTMFIVWGLAHLGGEFNSIKLLLSGIIVGMFFSAVISLLMYLNLQEIGNIINVLMGNLGRIFSRSEWSYFLIIFVISILLMIYLFLLSHKLTIMSTGDLVATSLGLEVKKLRRKIFIISSLLTGITVSYAGIIGFVGLVVPHMVRILARGNKRYVMIVSAFAGAFLLIICDLIAKNIAPIELPVGVITAFIGCPFFIFILARK